MNKNTWNKRTNIKIMRRFFVLLILGMFLLTNIAGLPIENTKAIQTASTPPTITINIQPNSVVYEGDLIDCDISGEVSKWWWIDRNQNGIRDPDENKHYTFHNDDPQIFRPEATPIDKEHVDLFVTATNQKNPCHSFAKNGTYEITLSVIDDNGKIDYNKTKSKIEDKDIIPPKLIIVTPKKGIYINNKKLPLPDKIYEII